MSNLRKKFLVELDLTQNQIKNVAEPTQNGDVATYEWVNTGIEAVESELLSVETSLDALVSREISTEVSSRISGDESFFDLKT